MRTLGIDPSSSVTGIALVEDFQLRSVHLWMAKGKDVASNLLRFKSQIESSHWSSHIDSICVEKVSVTINMNAVRRIAYMEAIALLIAEEMGCSSAHINPTHARKVVFGKGNIKKDEVYEHIVDAYPTIRFLPFKNGGSDQTDAVVLALAMQMESKSVSEWHVAGRPIFRLA